LGCTHTTWEFYRKAREREKKKPPVDSGVTWSQPTLTGGKDLQIRIEKKKKGREDEKEEFYSFHEKWEREIRFVNHRWKKFDDVEGRG